MNKEIVIADQANEIAHIALQKSGSAADYMLMNLAEQGDEYALEVARLLPPSAKSAIVREHDFTKPSLFGLLSEPKDVVDIMVGDPITWPNVEAMDGDDMKKFVADIVSLATSLILSKEDEVWREQVFAEIAQSEEAVLYLAIAFMGCVFDDGSNGFIFRFPRSEIGHGTLADLHSAMAHANPELVERIGTILLGQGEWKYGPRAAIVSDVYASAQETVVESTKEALDMFEDL